MSIEELVNRAYTTLAHDKGTSWTDHIRAALAEAAQVPVMGEAFQLDCYDAGLLGYEHLPNAEQWHDYIRSELARAHDFYQDQFDNLCSPPLAVMGSPVAWTSPEWLKEKGKLHGMTRPHPSFKLPLYRAPTTCITQAELDALRKDAERYRWLRDGEKSAGTGMTDEAIDAHIAKERQE